MKILIIEKEKDLANKICSYFINQQYFCELAHTYYEALRKIEMYEYECILLNLSLHGKNDISLLTDITSLKKTNGVIVLSDTDSLDDKIACLLHGADDYLVKPIHLSELSARVYSVIRRKQFDGCNQLQVQEIEIDLSGMKVSVAGNLLDLTKREYNLLMYFISHKNKVVSKCAIAEHLGGDEVAEAGNCDFIYSHIKNLKKKLTQAGCSDYIRSLYGIGYKLSVPS